MKIDFFLRFYTQPNQSLHITGNHFLLGDGEEKKALPMQYYNAQYWHATIDIDPKQLPTLQYHYIFKNELGELISEFETGRVINLQKLDNSALVLADAWNHAGNFENAFYTAAFQETLLKDRETKIKSRQPKQYTHQFKVKAPLLQKNEALCLIGSGPLLGEWSTENPQLMHKEDEWWTARILLHNDHIPFFYKYGIYNTKTDSFTRFEEGANRSLPGPVEEKKITIVHDGFAYLPNNTWHGAGVAIPVFSLKSKNSFGVGEFTDLKLLVDWAKSIGLKLIQLLPVNDTTATHTYTDSYPYASISAFALHPIYINLQKVAGKKNAKHISSLKKKQKQLNDLPDVDYTEVVRYKLDVLQELYELDGKATFDESEFKDFFDANRHWLEPYAVFCYLRDKYGTSHYNEWKTNAVFDKAEIEKLTSKKSKAYKTIALQYFIQYHLHLQLKEAADYAHKNGLVLKGDIPIGVYRYGCDAWMSPELFHMDQQAGAPPDDFAIKGQNWGFPTYNWEKMQEDHFSWWRQRFEQMSNYFSAFRIDHILGFFRIWSIPMHAVEGILGHFEPAIAVHINEFSEKNTWFDYRRYCMPFINDTILDQVFGDLAAPVKNEFLIANASGGYDLEMQFATQRQVQEHFASLEPTDENRKIQQGCLTWLRISYCWRKKTQWVPVSISGLQWNKPPHSSTLTATHNTS